MVQKVLVYHFFLDYYHIGCINKGENMPELRENYKKTDIKLALINELRSHSMNYDEIWSCLSDLYRRYGKVSKNCTNLADYKVCKRTVDRTIESIQEMYGDQLEVNKIRKIYKLELRDFPDTINEMEIQALDVAMQKMGNDINARKTLETLKAKLTSRLYRKIEQSEPKKAECKINDLEQQINSNYAFVGPRLIVDFDEQVKTKLDLAIGKQHKVSFKYYKNDTTVCPLGILYGPNNVYLIAYDCKEQGDKPEPRHYILSEISDLKTTSEWFARGNEFSIDEYANSMFGVYNDGKVYDVEWLIKDKKTIRVAKKYQFHVSQQFHDNPDGSLTIKMRTGGLRAISVFLAQWGGKIIPVAPKQLKDDYKNLLNGCVASISE